MKIAISFLLAAAVVVLLAVFALRDEPLELRAAGDSVAPVVDAPPPAVKQDDIAVPDATETEAAADEPAIEIVDSMDLAVLLREYGFGRLEGEWRNWAMSRGYPVPDGSDGYVYEQPYDQYDDETLRGLASNGDMWAQQILAKRISRTNPAEALELYRDAAIRGSIYAMSEMANLYARIGDKRREVEFKSQDSALEQIYAMRDAPVPPEVSGYAWTAVAEMSGTEPMFGNVAASQLARRLTDEQKEEACSMAQGIYDEVMERRSSLGLGDFDRRPPPIVYWDPASAPICSEDNEPNMDLSGCRQIQMTEDNQTNTIWICADE